MKRLPIALGVVIMAIVMAAAPVMATCQPVIDPDGSLIGPCADPRVKAVMDNGESNVPVLFKLVHKAGKDGTRKVHKRNVGAGVTHVTSWHWVKGGGSKVRLTFWNPETRTWDLLAKMRVRTNGNAPWGSPGCVKDSVVVF